MNLSFLFASFGHQLHQVITVLDEIKIFLDMIKCYFKNILNG